MLSPSITVRSSMSFQPEQPQQDEIEFEPRIPLGMIDVDGRDSSQQSPAALRHSTREESDAPSTPLASPNLLSTRPNTHRGAPSTWRSRMVSERRLAASLDHLSAKDLAVHLYNAFALGQRARNLKSRNEANNGISEQAWSPPSLWTAWPLAPAFVPLEDEGLRWESESYQNGHTCYKKLGPREVLEDILIGHLQKKAKERFLKWHRRDVSLNLPDVDHDENDGLDLLEPAVMADDDLARNLTEPTVRHAFAKLDGLLTALHHARHAYVTADSSASDSHDNLASREVQQKLKSSHKSRRNDSRSGTTKARISTNPSPFQVETDLSAGEQPKLSIARNGERSNSKNQGAKRSKRRKRRYALRDWSDVIGVSAMTSWEPKTVQRAAARCATLFEEGLKFRTLEENGNAWDELSILPNTRVGEPGINPDGIPSKEQGRDVEPVRAPKPRRLGGDNQGWRFYCPVTDCNRSSHGFWEARRLTRHLKGVHKELNLQSVPYESEDQMVGGVHVDGFLQLMPMPSAWANKPKRLRRTKD